ncbi:MAG: PHP domain-containing protein [Nitrospinota bacterium]|nr:MAG: PHP domain-containing protein [Nitrospinota bacterium]
MPLLKVELHAHAMEDPYDRGIRYSARQLIDRVVEQKFDVLALTLHGQPYYPEALERYAAEQGLLLIPGVEAYIEGRHILLYNFDFSTQRLRSFEDIRRHQNEETLVIAPHPYYPGSSCLHSLLERHIDLFDAVEYCHFYLSYFNPFNRRAEEIARRFHLPLVGTSDIHHLWQIGWTYSLVEGEKSVPGVIEAIKRGRVQVVTRPLPSSLVLRRLGADLRGGVGRACGRFARARSWRLRGAVREEARSMVKSRYW